MKKSKLEKVLEYMVNGESDLASEMLHEHIIESAREIYADLAEEDDAAEADLELDEDADEDLDEGYFDDNKSGDFEDDIESMEDEVETEEYFGEDDDDMDDDMDDLEGEMDMGMDDEMGDMDDMDDMDMDDEMGDAVPAVADIEDSFVNVDDAIEELKAIFANVMGDDLGNSMDDNMNDEVADTFGGDGDLNLDSPDEYEDDEEEDDFEESFAMEDAKLNKVAVKKAADTGDKTSPIRQNQPAIGKGGKAVNFAGGGDEKGGKGDSAKKMSVTGPQEQKGKMDKKVATPSNKSEKAKSNIGS
jgi:hypothetical protein